MIKFGSRLCLKRRRKHPGKDTRPDNNLQQPKSDDLLMTCTSGSGCLTSNGSDTRGKDSLFMASFFLLCSIYFGMFFKILGHAIW